MTTCPLKNGDIIRSAAFGNAWLDGEAVGKRNGKPAIVDGDVWICDQSLWNMPEKQKERLVLCLEQEHELTDAERVAVFEDEGRLGPKTKMRTVKIKRQLTGPSPRMAIICGEPDPVSTGVWHVVATELDPTAAFGQARTRYNFYLTTEAAAESPDPLKTVKENLVFLAPAPDQPLFSGWLTGQMETFRLHVGNILSGAELRWYLAEADREALYLVISAEKVQSEISVCAHSSTPRDCSDSWCGLRHSQRKITVDAGYRYVAQRIEVGQQPRSMAVGEERLKIFRSTDRDFTDACGKKNLHIAVDSDGNTVFRL